MPLLAVGAALHQRGHLRLHLTEHRSLTSPEARGLEVKEQQCTTSATNDSVHVLQCCGWKTTVSGDAQVCGCGCGCGYGYGVRVGVWVPCKCWCGSTHCGSAPAPPLGVTLASLANSAAADSSSPDSAAAPSSTDAPAPVLARGRDCVDVPCASRALDGAVVVGAALTMSMAPSSSSRITRAIMASLVRSFADAISATCAFIGTVGRLPSRSYSTQSDVNAMV